MAIVVRSNAHECSLARVNSLRKAGPEVRARKSEILRIKLDERGVSLLEDITTLWSRSEFP
jgi:hypothetical protein